MCWHGGNRQSKIANPRVQGGIIIACAMWCGVGPGCATPRGVLFPHIDPAMLWPPPPSQPRIKLIGVLGGSDDLHAGQSALENFKTIIRGPRPPIRFSTPHSVAVHSRNLLAITDPGSAAVHIVDLTERTHTLVGGWSAERFHTPIGAAWVDDRLFVTDAGRGEVIELRLGGEFVRRFGGEMLSRPVGIVFARSRGSLYVVDGAAHRLAEFQTNGDFVRYIGVAGAAPGQFNYPTHICADDQSLYVADSGNFRVQVLDFDGNVLHTYGRKGDAAGDFALPKGIAVDSDGHVYVVDAQFENVQVFTREGQLLMAFGTEGSGLGRFWLPAGIAIDSLDRVWVADSGNRRLQVFRYLCSATGGSSS